MKAIVFAKYGPPDVLQYTDVPEPKAGDNEVLVKLRAAAVNPLDFHQMRGHVRVMTGVLGPKHKILGCDIAGRIEAAGSEVKDLRPGDEVFGVTGLSGGGFAEYVRTTGDRLALKPSNITFEQAAAVPVAAITALQGLRNHGQIQAGQNVLIDGASGGVGTFAIQIAKSFGAEVTAVCSTRNVDQARSLGADHVIDYKREDFTKLGRRYHLILGVNAFHSVFDYRRALEPGGAYVMAGGGTSPAAVLMPIVFGPLLSLAGRKRMAFFIAKVHKDGLYFLKSLLENGRVRPVIDRCYPLSDTADAIRYLEQGHAQGKIVLKVE